MKQVLIYSELRQTRRNKKDFGNFIGQISLKFFSEEWNLRTKFLVITAGQTQEICFGITSTLKTSYGLL